MNAIIRTRRQSLALLGAALAVPRAAMAAAVATPALDRSLPEAEFTPDGASTDLAGMEDMLRRMTAPVMINGQGPFDFVVDTGTNRSIISDELAERLSLPAGRIVHLHGIGGDRDAPPVTLDHFQVGERAASRLSLPVLSAKSLRCAGILGVDGLKNQRVVLNLRDQRLQIEPSSKRDRSTGASIMRARTMFDQLTLVDTDLNGIQVSVLIDTGAEATVGNSALRRALDRRRRRDDPATLEKVTLQGATGETTTGDFGGVPEFRIGKLRVGNLRVVYADLHPFELWGLSNTPAMLMGMDLIRLFDAVSLDYGRSEVRFTLPGQPFIDPTSDAARRF